MKIILNDQADATNFGAALSELVEGAATLSVAVSYVQMSGWNLFRQRTPTLNLSRMRMVCTDQLGITQPAAINHAIASGVQVRNFSGNVTYHPKVFLAHNNLGQPTRFLVASANLSYSAFTTSIEAGVLGADPAGATTLHDWFNNLFENRCAQFTPERLRRLEESWRTKAALRTRARLQLRRELTVVAGATGAPPEAEDLDALEDVFSTVQLPLGLLNMDYAANNIRNVGRVRDVLANWSAVRASTTSVAGKQRNELKLLGFAQGRDLTALGQAAVAAASREEVARLWCAWLQQTPDTELAATNAKLPVAKRVLTQFWRLQPEVRDYFLANAESPVDRQTLKTIELLCNARDVVQELSLDDIRTLSPLLEQPQRLPQFVSAAVMEYQENKGTRSWDSPDRRIIPQAWQAALAR